MFQDWVKEEIMTGEDTLTGKLKIIFAEARTPVTQRTEISMSLFDGTALPSGGRATNL